MEAGRRKFRTTFVRPYVTPQFEDEAIWDDHTTPAEHEEGPQEVDGMVTTLKQQQSDEGQVGKHLWRKHNPELVRSGQDEMNGLLEEGTFKMVRAKDVPDGTRVFGSRFIDEVKRAGEMLRRNSRLVAQNYIDEDARRIGTKAPTIQRFSQRTLLSLAVSFPSAELFSRDVTQAYIQATKPLERPFFIKAPSEMCLPADAVILVVKPLCGIP